MPKSLSFLQETPSDLADARRLQDRARGLVEHKTRIDRIRLVAGVDVGFEDQGRTARGAVVVLSFPKLELVDRAVTRRPVSFRYQPGYLSFREVPVLVDALAKITHTPDVILCDGQGVAHPRRFGLACHLGLIADIATIGVAKSRLLGTFGELPEQRGARVALMHKYERIGSVVRTRTGTQPLFISIGHRVGLRKAENLVLACCPRYRLPETTRAAHRLASG